MGSKKLKLKPRGIEADNTICIVYCFLYLLDLTLLCFGFFCLLLGDLVNSYTSFFLAFFISLIDIALSMRYCINRKQRIYLYDDNTLEYKYENAFYKVSVVVDSVKELELIGQHIYIFGDNINLTAKAIFMFEGTVNHRLKILRLSQCGESYEDLCNFIGYVSKENREVE